MGSHCLLAIIDSPETIKVKFEYFSAIRIRNDDINWIRLEDLTTFSHWICGAIF